MRIGDVAEQTGLPAKTIRYYEDIDLISPPRAESGYRDYRESDLHKLQFLGRARALGFSIEDCRGLLKLWEDRSRTSSDVRRIALDHLQQIDRKIEDLRGMRDTLATLVHACAGDARPDCPILEDLAGPEKPTS